MTDPKNKNKQSDQRIPRVLADFGGRRKVFERRLHRVARKHLDRRSGSDRRSGFDRRSTDNQHNQEQLEKRNNVKD